MIEGLEAAQHAAYDYTPRNEGEEPHVNFIRALLDDAVLRAGMLDDIATGYDREQKLREAHANLRAAELEHATAQPASPVAEPALVEAAPETA